MSEVKPTAWLDHPKPVCSSCRKAYWHRSKTIEGCSDGEEGKFPAFCVYEPRAPFRKRT